MEDVEACFRRIKKIWNLISDKLEKDLNIKYSKEETIKIYYTLLLVAYGIRNGTYIESIYNGYEEKFGESYSFENKKFCDYVYRVFSKIKTIPNLDIYVGSIYDNSVIRDTIYVYNKNNPFLGNIEKLENMNSKKHNDKLHKYIAELLGYDVVKYLDIYNSDKSFNISYMLFDNNSGKYYEIMSYQSYKNKLISNYERLKSINKIINKLGVHCTLNISDVEI